MPPLQSLLAGGQSVLCPGVYDALTAAMAEAAGFQAVYLSGASVAYTRLGRPDIGLVGMTEMADLLGRIRERIALPIVVDGDTGFGNALGAQRTIRVFERAGADAVQIEDQTFPKRCGHLRDKTLISPAEMAGKIRACVDARDRALIIARTDAIAVEGFERAIARAELYLEAGADVLFIEAPETEAQLADIPRHFAGRAAVMANMIEGGRTPMHDAGHLARIGYQMVIFPGALVRALSFAAREFFATLHRDGTTEAFRHRMYDFNGLNALLGTDAILAEGRRYDDV
jgi:2-methylisocitrate lyase-like PEP mutase family enzyme